MKAKVEQKLAAHPSDARTLRQMGALQRKLGDFGAASETYRKLKAVDDDGGGALADAAASVADSRQRLKAMTK